MKKLYVLIALAILVTVAVTATAGEEEKVAGHKLFLEMKCHNCHAVSSVGIESRIGSAKLKGPDLVDLEENFETEWIVNYLEKKADKEGKSHAKPFKGSDEELQVLVDWLLEQKAES